MIAAPLHAPAPVPRLLWTIDQGPDGWVVLAFEDIDGRHPVEPWKELELKQVVEALTDLGSILTPPPIETESAGAFFAGSLNGWATLLKGEEQRHDLHSGTHPDEQPTQGPLDDWSRGHLEQLAGIESSAPAAVAGDTLLHLDVRADNILLTPEGVLFVDWPHARTGAAWVNVLGLAASVAMQSGPDPETLLAMYAPIQAAPRDAVTATIVSLAGFFTHRSLLPEPPNIPNLRAFQAAQAAVCRDWIARRLGWT